MFARRAGQQITRAYNANPANPRSSGQMAQRMLMSTAIQAYRFFSPICDHSFEDAVGKNGNMRAFMSAALRDLKSNPSLFAFQRYGDRALNLGPYQVSAGSLSKLAAPVVTASVDNAVFTFGSIAGDSVKMADAAALLGLYKVGDMCTVVFAYPSALGGSSFGYFRATLVSSPGNSAVAPGNAIPSSILKIEAPSGVIIHSGDVLYIASDGSVRVQIDAAPAWLPSVGADYFSCAAIRSQFVDGKWLRSPAQLVMGAGFVPAPTYGDALATYPQNSAPILNGGKV